MKIKTMYRFWWLIFIVIILFSLNLPLPSFYLPAAAAMLWVLITICFVAFVGGEIYIVRLFFAVLFCIYIFARIYRVFGIIDDTGVVYKDFLTCLYFSLVTFTTLGFGDFHPTESVRIIAGVEAFLGYMVMALFVAALILKLQQAGKKIREDEKGSKPKAVPKNK